MIKIILKILLDETGIGPALAAGLTLGGSALVGGLFGKKKQETVDPYANLRGDYQNYIQGKLGTSTPYEYNPDFELPQPEVEKALESTVLDKLGNLPTMRSDIQDIHERYYGARKAQMEERNAEEQVATKNMYNRLGLVSSTPGLKAQSDLMRKQQLDFDELESELELSGIGHEMAATQLAEEIINQYLNQAQTLGAQQREYSKFPIQTSMADIQRKTNEELGYASLAGGLLSGNPPDIYMEDNLASQLGQTGQDVGTLLMLQNLLNPKKTTEKTDGENKQESANRITQKLLGYG